MEIILSWKSILHGHPSFLQRAMEAHERSPALAGRVLLPPPPGLFVPAASGQGLFVGTRGGQRKTAPRPKKRTRNTTTRCCFQRFVQAKTGPLFGCGYFGFLGMQDARSVLGTKGSGARACWLTMFKELKLRCSFAAFNSAIKVCLPST